MNQAKRGRNEKWKTFELQKESFRFNERSWLSDWSSRWQSEIPVLDRRLVQNDWMTNRPNCQLHRLAEASEISTCCKMMKTLSRPPQPPSKTSQKNQDPDPADFSIPKWSITEDKEVDCTRNLKSSLKLWLGEGQIAPTKRRNSEMKQKYDRYYFILHFV